MHTVDRMVSEINGFKFAFCLLIIYNDPKYIFLINNKTHESITNSNSSGFSAIDS